MPILLGKLQKLFFKNITNSNYLVSDHLSCLNSDRGSATLTVAMGQSGGIPETSQAMRGLLCILLICCGDVQTAAAPPDISATPVLRFEQGEEEWQGRLQTAINTYRNEAGVQVELVAAIHIADLAYYEELNEYFRDRDQVLYELVADSEQMPAQTSSRGSGLSFLQRALAGFLELSFQLQEIDYTATNFVHADMNPAQLQAVMTAKNESFFSMMMAVALAQVASITPESEVGTTGALQVMAALAEDNQRDALKYLLARELASSGTMAIDPALEAQLTLVGDRNRIALQRLEESLEDPANQTLSLFFGAAHLAGLERELVNSFGFRFVDQRWLTAWSIP